MTTGLVLSYLKANHIIIMDNMKANVQYDVNNTTDDSLDITEFNQNLSHTLQIQNNKNLYTNKKIL